MKVSKLIIHLEAFQREYGDVEVDCVAEKLWTREEALQHIVVIEETLREYPDKEPGLQIESSCNDVAYSPADKHIKLMAERF